jgi:hypothetical protein
MFWRDLLSASRVAGVCQTRVELGLAASAALAVHADKRLTNEGGERWCVEVTASQ